MSAAGKKKSPRVQISNKRASFDYEFLEQYDAGIVLVGTEIKSLRAGKASLADAWCYFSGGELYVKGMNISTYFWASKWGSHEPARDRKLLLTRRELRHLEQATKTKGLTIVAVRAYIADNGFAKLHIALARGKKEFDKRATIREKDIRRELERG
ncbi:MAG: SsrA-binding protein SmpB [Bacteroidales bacterium]|nr:SsrA-binding protein SmpB [Bacteroidales bacterium]